MRLRGVSIATIRDFSANPQEIKSRIALSAIRVVVTKFEG